MSYARFGLEGSDVYVYETVDEDGPSIVCFGCKLYGDFASSTIEGIVGHLHLHRERGDCVPNSCFQQIEERGLTG